MFFICPFAFAAEKASVSLSGETAFVGDIIDFKITAQLPPDAQISAGQKVTFENFDIIGYGIERVSENPNIYELNFKIAAYKTGVLDIEPVSVSYINADGSDNLFFTPEAKVEIKSVLGGQQNQDIKDIKPLVKLGIKPLYVFLMILAAAIAGILIFFLYRSISASIKIAPAAVIDPRTQALDALNGLYVSGEPEKSGVKIFYYRMSEILRGYVSKQYGFDALEMTTAEFFDKMKPLLPQEININEFKNYLKVFNLARYAGFKPEKAEVEGNFNYTKNLLEKL